MQDSSESGGGFYLRQLQRVKVVKFSVDKRGSDGMAVRIKVKTDTTEFADMRKGPRK